jgi:ubiquinone/menaquinone biosynthesis C-methylase UbiE
MERKKVKEFVKKRYGEIAQNEQSCCYSSSCCGPSTIDIAKEIGYSERDLENVPDSAILGLGCGNPVELANLEEGETVLDLGSGGGIDVFLASKKVGKHGKVIGVDMTEEMLEKAKASAMKYGYTNVEFRLGEIENLPIEDETVDTIISNCVINLSPDKLKVFQEAYRVLKPNGKIIVSDIVTKGKLPEVIRKSFDAWAGCIAGALEKNEYLDTIKKAGFGTVKIISEKTYTIDISDDLAGKIISIQVEALKST